MPRSFILFNFIQGLAALNENLFRFLVAFFVIAQNTSLSAAAVMATTGGTFILPFLLFSNLGGFFADRMSKKNMIIFTRGAEALILIVGLFCFIAESSIGAYVVLFFMASFSAILGPSKYGIIPEISGEISLLRANSHVTAYTFLGIILGTAFASIVDQITRGNYPIAIIFPIAFAVIATILSFLLPYTPVKNPSKKLKFFIFKELSSSIRDMRKSPPLLAAVFAYSYFLLIGSFVQLNVVPFTIIELQLSDVIGGYLFLLTAIGMGIGSFLTSKISKSEIKLSMVIYAGYSFSCFMIFLGLFPNPWWLSIIWFLLLGFFGGLFLVPSQTFILDKSPAKDRGRNFGSANFFSFVFALLAALAIYCFDTLIKMTPSESFITMAIINGIVITILRRHLLNHRAKEA